MPKRHIDEPTERIKSHWKLGYLLRLTRLKNAGELYSADVDIAFAIADLFYENSLAEASLSFLANRVGLRKRTATRSVGALERAKHIVIRYHGKFRQKDRPNKYALVLWPEDFGEKDAARLGITCPVASDTLEPTGDC
jgi:hypothetical protein